MSRTPARIRQADVARAIRAAKQTGAGGVEIRPDGTIFVVFSPNMGAELGNLPPAPVVPKKKVVL